MRNFKPFKLIIPQYYFNNNDPSKILNINYYDIIKDDIRNYRVLKKNQLEYIKKLPSECKYQLIDIFNDCLRIINQFTDTLN